MGDWLEVFFFFFYLYLFHIIIMFVYMFVVVSFEVYILFFEVLLKISLTHIDTFANLSFLLLIAMLMMGAVLGGLFDVFGIKRRMVLLGWVSALLTWFA